MRYPSPQPGDGVNTSDIGAVNHLSDTQKAILVRVLAIYRWYAEHGNDFALNQIGFWGVELRCGGGTGSERASRSRALRRLEDRGLIRRRNNYSGDRWHLQGSTDGVKFRTTNVELTDEGRALAERLTPDQSGSVNRRATA